MCRTAAISFYPLSELQQILRTYTKMLSDMADVEDLTELEDVDGTISQPTS